MKKKNTPNFFLEHKTKLFFFIFFEKNLINVSETIPFEYGCIFKEMFVPTDQILF